MGFKKVSLEGVTWVGAFRGFVRLIGLIKNIILARLLSPSQFGEFGIAILVLSFLEVFTETGINILLLQLKSEFTDYINSAWFISIMRGFSISALMFISAPLIAHFFENPNSVYLIQIAALIPFVRGFINPSEVKFQKDLLFKDEFTFRFICYLADATVAVLLTIKTHSVVSLILGLLVGAIVEVILSHILLNPHPKLTLDYSKIKYILTRGKWLTISGILDYIIQNGDNLVVGKILGPSALGIYQEAYQISIVPVTEISTIISKVTLPIFIKISEKQRVKKAYKVTLFITVCFVTSICALYIFLGKEIVGLTLGDKWITIVPVLRVLAIFIFLKSIVISIYSLLLSQGKQEQVTLISLVGFIVMFTIIVPLVNSYGLQGAALAATTGAFISLIPAIWFYYKV